MMQSIMQSIMQPIMQPIMRGVMDARRSGFNVRSLFAKGQKGAWYDPSDLSTLFQDAAGTISVTGTGQPVGLMLDKRLGLVRGAELASGLTPFSDASGTTTHTESAITTTGSLGGVTLPLTVGNWYALSATGGTSATELSINTANLAINPTARTVIRTTIGDCVFLADKPFLYLRQSGAGTGTVNSLSLKELPGNHATQATAASRALAVNTPSWKIDYDAVDDNHIVTFPSTLGSSCTVARAIPSVGASIIGSQTIGTSYTSSADFCALVIIDRALTAAETSALTAYLNRKAGV